MRQRALDAARRLFFTRGFHAVTMDDLARQLGVSKKTLYLLFPGKEALLDAVLDDFAARVGQTLAEILGQPKVPAAEKLRRVVSAVAERLSEIQPAFLLSLERHAPRQFERIEELRRRNLQMHLVPMLEAARARGEIRREIEPAFAVDVLLMTLHSIIDASAWRRMNATPSETVRAVLDLFIHGILKRP